MEKLTRCGACGAFQQDPQFFSAQEQENPEIVDCGCRANEVQYITRDMAIDAGYPEMEGERY